MSKWWMITAPRKHEKYPFSWKHIHEILNFNDCKKWIVAEETGKNGYQHYQIRLETSNKEFFEYMQLYFPFCHVEEAAVQNFDYERKEGRYWTSEDTYEIRQCRFGHPNERQIRILRNLDSQSVRQVDVWYDPDGSKGKSWLAVHLWEVGKAMVVPRAQCTPERLSAFICSAYKGEPYIIIDLPRASKPKETLYEAMEEIKDGLVFDHRYEGKTRNIRGVKLVVFTNHKLELKKLSYDRWRLHGI